MSGPHQLQFWPPGNFITRNAPFGTQDTPSTCVKIIGSKYVPVVETRLKGSKADGYGGPRQLLVLDPIAEKPTRMDPALLSSNFQSPRTLAAMNSTIQRTTPLGFRPDSKTAKLTPYSTLPPIQRHRTKNQMSTVFEPESWTISPRHLFNGEDAGNAGYLGKVEEPDFLNQRLMNNIDIENESTTRDVITTDTQTDDNFLSSDMNADRKCLLGLLPRTLYLPTEPLILSKEDEFKLIRVLNKEMQGVHPNQLREIYTVLSAIDYKLTGWCSFQHLTFALTKKQVHISTDLLRLVAAMFVSPDRHLSGVNYEKILSLLGTALKMMDSNVGSDEGHDPVLSAANQPLLHYQQSQKTNSSKYFNNPHDHVSKDTIKDSPMPDQDIAKLIRISENQLLKADHTINFDRLAASFQMADRDHRETLSAAQIKEVCYQNRLTLEEWVIDQILLRCCDASIGQYNWHKFVSFLERVQPIHTGLRIPSSKKPRDYARNYPSPLANWPKATERSHGELSSQPLWQTDRETLTEKDEQIYEPKSGKTTRDSPHQKKNSMQMISNHSSNPETSQPASRQRTDSQHTINMEAINKLKSQVPSPLDEGMEPWFDRFMKLANALYKQDIEHNGFLPLEEVWKLVCTYNQLYRLNLSEEKIDKTLAQSMERGQVNLHQLLTTLGGVHG